MRRSQQTVISSPSATDAVADLLRASRYEVLPLDGIEEHVLAHVPRDVTVTVTASPTKGLAPTLALVRRLAEEGYPVVPHLSARLVRDGAHLTELVEKLRAGGVRDVFVVAGDAAQPHGMFEGAGGLLEALAEFISVLRGRRFTDRDGFKKDCAWQTSIGRLRQSSAFANSRSRRR